MADGLNVKSLAAGSYLKRVDHQHLQILPDGAQCAFVTVSLGAKLHRAALP
jgi:hypothetical protein